MALYDAYGERLAECDQQLEAMLAALGDPGKDRRRLRARNAPKFDVRAYLFGMCGVDLTRINGIDATTALKVIAVVGTDLSRFKSAKHFASWLGLCPGTKISGGKRLSGASKRTANRAAQALRLDRPKAITASASCSTSPGMPKNSASSSPRFLQSIKTTRIINQLKCVS